MMPEMDGVELCRHVRAMPNYAHVPIIMITASQHKDTLTSAIASGATDYVNKPFDGLELVTRLRAAESLMNATKAANAHARHDPVPQKTRAPSILQLADGFALDPKPGLVSQADLVCKFMETAQALKSMHVFAVAVTDVTRLFDVLPDHAFRAFVNELAALFSQITQSWDSRISYVGEGTFVVALFDVGFLSSKEIHQVLKAGLASGAFATLVLRAGETRLYIDYVGISDPDHCFRVDDLFKVAANAKRKAANQMTAKREMELRHQVLGGPKAASNISYEVSLRKAAPQKIVPRRFSNKDKGVLAAGESSTDRRIPEYRKNSMSSDL
jgi:hypothetical protein